MTFGLLWPLYRLTTVSPWKFPSKMVSSYGWNVHTQHIAQHWLAAAHAATTLLKCCNAGCLTVAAYLPKKLVFISLFCKNCSCQTDLSLCFTIQCFLGHIWTSPQLRSCLNKFLSFDLPSGVSYLCLQLPFPLSPLFSIYGLGIFCLLCKERNWISFCSPCDHTAPKMHLNDDDFRHPHPWQWQKNLNVILSSTSKTSTCNSYRDGCWFPKLPGISWRHAHGRHGRKHDVWWFPSQHGLRQTTVPWALMKVSTLITVITHIYFDCVYIFFS